MKSPFKVCTNCGEAKGQSSFFAHKTGRGGKHPWCPDCHAGYQLGYRAHNHASLLAGKTLYYHTVTKLDLEGRKADALRRRRMRASDPEKWKPIGRQYQHERRSLLRSVGGRYTPEEISEQLRRQKNRCFYCKEKITASVYTIDHVIPLSSRTRTSSNSIENLVLSCDPCNRSKGARDPMDFAGMMF